MSTLSVDAITGKSTSTNITIGSTPVVSASANSLTIRGEGSAQTSIQQGLAKAWFNLNAATPALRDSFNITDVTDEGPGTYEPNFTSVMGNANYSASGSSSTKGSTNSFTNIITTGDVDNTYGLHTTASIRFNNHSQNTDARTDPSVLQGNINGDLA
jgi:hypothetical protein